MFNSHSHLSLQHMIALPIAVCYLYLVICMWFLLRYGQCLMHSWLLNLRVLIFAPLWDMLQDWPYKSKLGWAQRTTTPFQLFFLIETWWKSIGFKCSHFNNNNKKDRNNWKIQQTDSTYGYRSSITSIFWPRSVWSFCKMNGLYQLCIAWCSRVYVN